MIPPPETFRVNSRRVACDGSGHGIDAALGHPRVFIEIDDKGYGECGYCDRRFVLAGGPADDEGLSAYQTPVIPNAFRDKDRAG